MLKNTLYDTDLLQWKEMKHKLLKLHFNFAVFIYISAVKVCYSPLLLYLFISIFILIYN